MPGASETLDAIVVGAGFSGIGAGVRLLEAGLDRFEILEREPDLGGTWRDATYPGVAVDIPSFTYSYSFEPNPDWSRVYAPGEELRAYAHHVAEKYGVRPHMRFDTEVERATFDARRDVWRVRTRDGVEREARYLISATGGLTREKRPRIDGLEEFAGPTLHTARWDHTIDLRGKRVAVIGTGASAVQVVPSIAPDAAHVSVFQRTPIWVLPRPDRAITDGERALFRHVPLAQRTVRAWTSALAEAVMVLGIIHYRETPQLVRAIERQSLAHLARQVSDPLLREKLTPRYGFGCKRPAFSNDYWRAFERDDVELVTDAITRVERDGVRTSDGTLHEVDVLILATGYQIWEPGNIPPYEVRGLGDLELGAFWRRHRFQAYQGATIPGFPNFFLVLGPYSASGASWFTMVEAQTRHALRAIHEAERRGATRVEVRRDVNEAYFDDILRRQRSTVFFNHRCDGANSYYFDPHGDAPFLRPSSGLEMILASRFFPLSAYRYTTARPSEETPMPIFEADLAVTERVRAPLALVFERLSDHEAMNDWPGLGEVRLLREGTPRNGLGAVRRVRARGLALDEEVVHWDPPHAFHYSIIKGLPIDHLGRVMLRTEGDATLIEWRVRMKSKVPFLAALAASQLRAGLPKALAYFKRITEAAAKDGGVACAAE
ncbi:MAG: NAD(P)-binding domain-containing protein [Sandaracinaceae bacterium]